MALIEATKKHDHVVVFYLYKTKKFENQEAQKWWISKSLEKFEKKLEEFNIKIEIIKTDSYKNFFEKLFNMDNFSIYWNKTYEPQYLEFDQYLIKKFDAKKLNIRYSKGTF